MINVKQSFRSKLVKSFFIYYFYAIRVTIFRIDHSTKSWNENLPKNDPKREIYDVSLHPYYSKVYS